MQFGAHGFAWEGLEGVEMDDFDRTSNHEFPMISAVSTPIRQTVTRQAQFQHFTLIQRFHLFEQLDRVDIEVEVLNWDGTRERELRVAFPLNLEDSLVSYEVPFGTVVLGKDQLDHSQLPDNVDTQYYPQLYGGDHSITFR